MIPRYSLPKMSKIWTDENKFKKMLLVELLACEAVAKKGKIPKDALSRIKKRAKFSIDRIRKIEEKTKHDVVAFITNLQESVGKDSQYIHMGLTSNDVLDTSLAIQMKEAADLILYDLIKLSNCLAKKAKKYKYAVMIGRTHGVHAEPITFGLKLALFYLEVKRDIERLKRAKDAISIGKLSGAVGTFSNIQPYVEQYVCKRLDLKPEAVASQVVQRDRHAEFLATVAIIGATLEKIATEIRHLQRTEVLEVEEPFTSGQKGSSAMPHKRNPVICERITGLSRILRANAMAGLENVSLWHERDISHSSVERIILPDSTILVDYMINKLIEVIDGLIVYPENMKKNLEKTGGLFNSQRILLALINKGLLRQRAYDIVQQAALASWQKERNFRDLISKDKDVRKLLSKKEIEDCFDLKFYLRNINILFKRARLTD